MKLHFYLRFHTSYGQSLWITGGTDELGNNDPAKAVPMTYLNDEFWHFNTDIRRKDLAKDVTYKYLLKNEDGNFLEEWGNDRTLDTSRKDVDELQLTDTWNHAGEFENTFFTAPFREILLPVVSAKTRSGSDKTYTHTFRVKAPLLQKQEVICLVGSGEKLGEWKSEDAVIMTREDEWWTIRLDLTGNAFPLSYKYGVYDPKEKKFLQFENGNNRLLISDAAPGKITILHDGFVQLPNSTWKGAGVAIPVFSLRSKNGTGVGEFADIRLLVDWAKTIGLKLIQLLPVNDTTATHTWMDSYPYAAISAFALHPLFINLSAVAGKENSGILSGLKKKQKLLNELPTVDYEQVMNLKLPILKELYEVMGEECFKSEDYKFFYEANKHWLQPYSAFSFFRDKYGNSKFEEWKSNNIFVEEDIAKLSNPRSAAAPELGFYCFVQYHLHLQLKDAVDYAHKKGIVLKGDIPIGIYRNGCDAWMNPELYNMNWQAGAPPDDFAATGQNWGFPTYNWERMEEDGFGWWKQRFEQMSNYFDAFRIDHILGFFRIWSIPEHAVQGIMGRFVPCLPVHINEFGENGIWFDYQRYCRPFINDEVLWNQFGDQQQYVKDHFLVVNNFGTYDLELKFETQRLVEEHFATLEETPENETLKNGLFHLISNVILFEEEGSQGQSFHFRIAMEKTESYRFLSGDLQHKLSALCTNYFFRRQDDFWFREAMHKLPRLKAATNMLVCGEDLGMVPHCVPEVMRQLGILSLEIQRMPKDPKKEFFHPNDAPYLSVVTPSTHDMSTIRGWWEENRDRTQLFYNTIMGQWGEAPYFCESWINRAIVLQHLYSPAMWSIFQLQDILGMSETLRRQNPQEERINDPANPKNYWQYRMHLSIEELIKQNEFNEEFRGYITHSGR